ncbi:MAG: hypothetical protein GEU95_21665 [Rhizobiales bacterium]|nr:hypothetical protein [Hyphomicrobiales bacterium]
MTDEQKRTLYRIRCEMEEHITVARDFACAAENLCDTLETDTRSQGLYRVSVAIRAECDRLAELCKSLGDVVRAERFAALTADGGK